jgi:hypothetical protein
MCDKYVEMAIDIAKDDTLRAKLRDGPIPAALTCYAAARAEMEKDWPELAHEAGLVAVALLFISFGEDIGRKKAMGQ